jgi:hypothetical protein
VRLIEEEQVIRHQQNVYFSTLTRENNIEKEKAEQNAQPIYTPSQHELHLCDCACHQFHIENSCMDCNCGSD